MKKKANKPSGGNYILNLISLGFTFFSTCFSLIRFRGGEGLHDRYSRREKKAIFIHFPYRD